MNAALAVQTVPSEPAAPDADASRRALGRTLDGLRTRHGWSVGRNELEWQWRHWRWMLTLPAHVAFVARDEPGWSALVREDALLCALQPALGPLLPTVTLHDPQLRVHMRRWVLGASGHDVERLVFGADTLPADALRYHDCCPLTDRGRRLADDLGRGLALMHGAITLAQARAIGLQPRRDTHAVHEQAARVLAEHVRERRLIVAFEHARRWWDGHRAPSVVLHGDPHMFNLRVSPHDGGLRALLDLDEAHLGPREVDLRYLCSNGVPFARRALAAYRVTSRVAVDEDAVWRAHVLSAFEHFSWVSPSAERFPKIVGWATAAVEQLVPAWSG